MTDRTGGPPSPYGLRRGMLGLARLTALSRAGLGTNISRAYARLILVGGDGLEPPTLSV